MTTEYEVRATPYRSTDPATGATVHTVEATSEDEVSALLERADAGFRAWRATPVEQRAAVVAAVGALFAERAPELARLAALEMGKPVAEGEGEVQFCGSIFGYYAQEGPALCEDVPLHDGGAARTVVPRRPVGAVLGIMPWNFPYYQVARFVAPNLLLGNAVVVKHAESVPACAEAIQQVMDDAGVPPGVYTTVFASHEQVARIIADDRVQGVSLTGSERAGAAVAAIAGAHLTKCVLELGGSDPYVVLDSADVAATAADAWGTRMYNVGQACNSNKRIIVHDELHDELVDHLVALASASTPASPSDARAVGHAPMASRAGAQELAAQVADAVAQGAVLHVGGDVADDGSAYFAPAVLTGVHPGMRAYDEELFGPVLVVHRVSSDDEAVALANDSVYGLGAAVFSTDDERAARVADRLEVGMARINCADAGGPAVPVGGIKRSGFGRELGALGLDEFANRRVVSTGS